MIQRRHFVGDQFERIYYEMITEIFVNPEFNCICEGKQTKETTGASFILTDPKENLIHNVARGMKFDFARKFFDWILAGESDVSKLYSSNDNAKKYDDDSKGRNTAYGPRINAQIEAVIKELQLNPGSRRPVIHILLPEDLEMLDDKRKGQERTEYPCTIAIQFMIRNNDLNMYVMMRSNNIVTTLCYDVYNFTNLMMYVCSRLNEINLGWYHHHMMSAHIYKEEEPLVRKILHDYAGWDWS